MNSSRRLVSMIEQLDFRRLLAYSAYAQLVNQDDAISAYSNITGKGVTVAVIDTGVDYNHTNLGGGFGAGKKVVAGYDFYSNDSDPMDESGHGTMVAGTIAASSYTVGGVTYQGVAPDAKIVALRVGTESSIPYSNIEKALQWVIDKYDDYGISIINLSLGSGNYTDSEIDDTLSDEFETLHNLGIFVVAASGNSNESTNSPITKDGIAYPAADPNVFAVAAVNSSDVITSWSQRGDELDLLAPGENLVMLKKGGGTATSSGTSFASPYVAGAAALIKQALSTAKAGDIGSILLASGVNNRDGSGETGNTTTLQFSRLNILGALNLVANRNATNSSPNLGRMYDTALDSQGVLHAAFFADGKLAYATRSTDGTWSKSQIVDSSSNVGYYISIAVDGTGKAGISYFDANNTSLKYASFGGATWSTTSIDSSKNVGSFTSLAFDIDGNAYIAYYKRSGGQLKFATLDRDAGTWTKTIVDSGNVGTYASIDMAEVPVLLPNGFTGYDTTLAIAYADLANGNLKYARLDLDDTAATWVMNTVEDLSGVANIELNLHWGPTSNSSQPFQAQIAYQDTANQDVKYAYKAGTQANPNFWGIETIASSGNNGASVQLTFDASDRPTVVYFSGTDRAVYQSVRSTAGVWSKSRIATSSGYTSVGFNERSGDSVILWLNRPKSVTYSEELI
jgi:subtilisin family serine protease